MLIYGEENSTSAIIFLHGYMQTAHNAKLLLSKTITEKFLQELSLVCFFPSRRWFDYVDDTSFDYKAESLHIVRKYVHAQLDALRKAYQKVILIGYSQGASVALDAALTYGEINKIVIPVIAISGLLLSNLIVHPGEHYVNNKYTIYVAHGIYDSCLLYTSPSPRDA